MATQKRPIGNRVSAWTPHLLPNKSTHSGHAVLNFPTPFHRLALYFFSDSVITEIHILIELCKIQTSTALNISVNTSTHLPTAMPQILAENWGQSWQLLGKNFLKLINKFSLQATQKSFVFLLFLLSHVNFLNHCLSLHSFLYASGHTWVQEQAVLLQPCGGAPPLEEPVSKITLSAWLLLSTISIICAFLASSLVPVSCSHVSSLNHKLWPLLKFQSRPSLFLF